MILKDFFFKFILIKCKSSLTFFLFIYKVLIVDNVFISNDEYKVVEEIHFNVNISSKPKLKKKNTQFDHSVLLVEFDGSVKTVFCFVLISRKK